MKRLDTKEGQYGVWLGLCIGIFSTVMGIYLSVEFPKTCTPSQEHQEIISQLSGINERLDDVMFGQNYLSDLLNK